MALPKATAQQICLFALRKLGVVNRQMPVQVDDMKDAIDALWFVLDTLSSQNLLIPAYQSVTTTLTESKRVLYIGGGGDFSVDCPIEIDSIVVNSGGTLYTVDRFEGVGSFNEVSLYGDQYNYPRFYQWNKSYPDQSITFDAMLLEGDIVTIYGLFPFSATFAVSATQAQPAVRTTPNPVQLSLTEETEFPVGYQSMLMWNVAEHLLAEYPQENPAIPQQIIIEAARTRNRLMNVNNAARSLQFTDTNRPSYWGMICDPYRWQ